MIKSRDDDKDLEPKFCDWVNGTFNEMEITEEEIHLYLTVANAALKELTGKDYFRSMTFGAVIDLLDINREFAKRYAHDDFLRLRERRLRKKQWAILITVLGECYQSNVDQYEHDAVKQGYPRQ